MTLYALPVRTDVAAVYRVQHEVFTEPIQIKFDDHCIMTSSVPGKSKQAWEGNAFVSKFWNGGSVAFLPRKTELQSDCPRPNSGFIVQLSESLFVKAAQDHIDYGRIDFRFADITDKTTQMLSHAMHHICMMEKFSNWPLLIETNALSLAVAAIAGLSPKASVAFQQKPYGFEGARRKRVLGYIEANLHRQMTLAELADVAGLSVFHFARLFKQKMGMTPLAYLANKRVEIAKTAMRSSGATLAQVALDCGFASQSHFSTCFKAVTGITPGQYRKQVAAPQISYSS